MRILFICYWGVEEGLTVATVFPHLKILSEFVHVEEIILCTAERFQEKVVPKELGIAKTIHVPLVSRNLKPAIINKVNDFIIFRKTLINISREQQIDTVICRGAPAGSLGYLLYKVTKLPFYVESYEPHSEYMNKSKVWSKFNLKYLFQHHWEKRQRQFSNGLMPVSFNYSSTLISKGVEANRINVIPCCVPLETFKFSSEKRKQVRDKLDIRDEMTAVYVGKFGGLYYDKEAYEMFRFAFDFFNNKFRLIILTPHSPEEVIAKIHDCGIDENKVFVSLVPHTEIPGFLSASDFAFSNIMPANKNCSPIKNGEYWANGLPILMAEEIGDDSEIIVSENAGATFNLNISNSFSNALANINLILNEPGHRERLYHVAEKYRSFDIAAKVYQKLYGKLS